MHERVGDAFVLQSERAGLLTGRYQQRFGHENNPARLPESTVAGLPLSQTTLPQVLKQIGYKTGAVGKWHLGAHPQFHPNRRGFDECFGMLGGGHVYLGGTKGGVEYSIPMGRNGQSEPLDGYLTEVLGREASAFVTRHKKEHSHGPAPEGRHIRPPFHAAFASDTTTVSPLQG